MLLLEGNKRDEVRNSNSQAEVLDKSAAQRPCPPAPIPQDFFQFPKSLRASYPHCFPFKPHIDPITNPPQLD